MIASYRDLDIWKKGIEIVDFIYEQTNSFPKKELFGLVSQMQRAAVSVPTNIAEGFARQYTKEYIRFCYIALGSCAELETLATIAKNQKYITEEIFKNLSGLLDHESRMLMSLTKKLINK